MGLVSHYFIRNNFGRTPHFCFCKMKILRYNPETVTVEKDGSVLVYNLDEIRRKAIHDDAVMEVLREYVKFKLQQRGLM